MKVAKEHFGEKVYLVLGGFHLGGYFGRKLDEIVWELKGLGVMKVASCHYSGDEVRKAFEKEYGKDFIKLSVGGKEEVKNGDSSKRHQF